MDDTSTISITDNVATLLSTSYSAFVDELPDIINNLHFVRADWFYAFIPLLLYLFLFTTKTQSNKNWHSVIDEKLLPFVLTSKDETRRHFYPQILIFIAGSLCITALAGPVYKKLPQPVYREQSALVVLLDMSASMNATDIKPSRLSRAKLKLLDLLKTRKTGQTALIVYAADAFVVTPLTDDNATIANLVPALETEMMPAQGSDLSQALAKTVSLFSQAGIIKGDILVITDDIQNKYEKAIEKVSSQGHRLSIMGVGTSQGGPVPLLNSETGGFLLDSDGAIVIPKLHKAKLQRLALAGSGLFTPLKTNDDDILRLTRLFQSKQIVENKSQQENADVWQEEGHWLLLPLLLLTAFWARKGWIAALLPFAFPLLLISTASMPIPALADSKAPVTDTAKLQNTENDSLRSDKQLSEKPFIDINNLWSTSDQKAMKAFNEGDNTTAADQFTTPGWKASAQYRNGDFESAVNTLKDTDSSDGFYNKGNALAKLGRYQEAIAAYDDALQRDENNEDARFNREQVKQALQKQQEQSQQEQSQQQQNQDQSGQDQQNQDQQDQSQQQQQNQNQQQEQSGQNQQNQNQQEQSQQQKDQSGQEQQDQKQQKQEQSDQQPASESEQQEAEKQELKQRDAEAEKQQQEQEQQEYKRQQQELERQREQQETKQPDSVEHDENKDQSPEDNKKLDPLEVEVNPMEASITEDEKATEQWLKRIPDDPGGLLRRKFYYQYKRNPNANDSDKPW